MNGRWKQCRCGAWYELVEEFDHGHDCGPLWQAVDEWGVAIEAKAKVAFPDLFAAPGACEAAEKAAACLARAGLAEGEVLVRVRPWRDQGPWQTVLVRCDVTVVEAGQDLFGNVVEEIEEVDVGAVCVVAPPKRKRTRRRAAA